MVSVKELVKSSLNCDDVELSGYLLERENRVFLIDKEGVKDWKKSPKIFVDVEDLKYALLMQLALKGGGVSSFFHDSKLTGVVFLDAQGRYFVRPKKIFSRNSKSQPWINIDFSKKKIEEGKKNHHRTNTFDYFGLLGEDPPDYK